MRIDIITVLPEMLEGFVHESILARAEKKGLAEIRLHNLRDYTLDKWRRVDDYPYGGSAGMVMQCEPIDRCITALKAERDYDEVIFTSPDGERFDQHILYDIRGCRICLEGFRLFLSALPHRYEEGTVLGLRNHEKKLQLLLPDRQSLCYSVWFIM